MKEIFFKNIFDFTDKNNSSKYYSPKLFEEIMKRCDVYPPIGITNIKVYNDKDCKILEESNPDDLPEISDWYWKFYKNTKVKYGESIRFKADIRTNRKYLQLYLIELIKLFEKYPCPGC